MKSFQSPMSLFTIIVFLLAAFVVNAQPRPSIREYPAREQMVWSTDGRYIASVGTDGLITVWDVETAETIEQINKELSERYKDNELTHIVDSMSWSTNNELVVATNGSVQIWNVSEGTLIASLEYPDAPQGTGIGADISKVVWTPDERMLLVASAMGSFSLWDSQTYQFVKFQESPDTFDLALRSDGRLAVGTIYGVAIFPSYSDTEYDIFLTLNDESLSGDEVVVVHWSFDGSYLLGITFDGRTYIWDRVSNSKQPVTLAYDLPYLNLSSTTLFLENEDWTVIEAGGRIARYDIMSGDTIQTSDLADLPLVAAWSPYGARVAYITANDPSVLHVEIPFASLDELSRILIRCDVEDETIRFLSEYIESGNIDRMVQELELLPETQLPAACRQDLLAMAKVLLQ